MSTSVQTTTIKIEEYIKKRVRALAESRHRTPHWLMQEAIREYIEREEKRETIRKDAMLAWETYQTTRLHVTLEEADAWLAQLADGNDLEPPACHV